MTLRSSLAAGELTPAEAGAIAALLTGTGAGGGRGHRPAAGQAGPTQPDRFEYHLRLADAEIVIPEADVPDALRPLVARLVDRARQRD
jgi:hypothetical protein